MKSYIKRILRKYGYWDIFLYRLFILSQPGFFLNVLVQYVFAINFKCKWVIHYTSKIIAPKKLIIDISSAKSLAVSGGIYIQAINGVTIMENVLIAPGVKIISANHNFDKNDRTSAKVKPIFINSDCWLGANSIILPGVEIGKNTIVGAGAIVTKSFIIGNVVLAGNPAKIINYLDNAEQ